MVIKRKRYLDKLIIRKHNGMIKVITGIRRCGKSFLLFRLFRDHLLESGIKNDQIIEVAFDTRRNEYLRDPDKLCEYVDKMIVDDRQYYIFLDEVQFLGDFEAVLNDLLRYPNVDIYVTGSNSRFLSSDIITEFRGRGDEIHIFPLSFAEYLSGYNGSEEDAWKDYYTFGGLPLILSMKTDEQKSEYLARLFKEVYIRDIIERNRILYPSELDELINILSSSIGSLTNPRKLAQTFKSVKNIPITQNTVAKYCSYLEQAFLVSRSSRFDVKGKKYIGTPYKYYFEDVGLRNAKLNFRQIEENHIMENIIYNELRVRGFNVDVGVVEIYEKRHDGRSARVNTEIDFVANLGSRRYYVQSALRMDTDEKKYQETRPLKSTNDSFKKIIIVGDNIKLKRDENGFVTMGIREFLLNSDSLDL